MTRIIIVEDVEYMADSVKKYLLAKPELGQVNNEIVNIVKNPNELFDFAKEYKRPVDIVVLDAVYRSGETLPVLSECLQALEKLSADKQKEEKNEYPCLKNSKIILLSQNDRILRLLDDVWQYISSCVDKDDLSVEMPKAVRMLSEGSQETTYFNKYAGRYREIVRRTNQNENQAFWEKLFKERQLQVLEGLLQGWTNDVIADKLQINQPNVATRCKEIYDKLVEQSTRKSFYNSDSFSRTWAIINLCFEFRHPLAIEMLHNNGIAAGKNPETAAQKL